jgi:5-amino-6-(5-phosphoribosylamino)uracil reductase
MTSSIDGRLLVDRWLRSEIEREQVGATYDRLAARLGADGWMVGRTTMADFASGTPRSFSGAFPDLRKPFVGNRSGRSVAVAIDLHGKLHYGQDNVLGDHVIAVLGQDVSDAYLAELRHDGVSYLLVPARDEGGAGSPESALHDAMAVLGETFGIRTLMLQGGGITNGAFLKAGLIDEISLVVYPGIDGLAGVPCIFEYHGEPAERPAEGQSLRHMSTETLDGGSVWLRYRVERAAAKR